MAFDLKNARVAVRNARAVVPIESRWRHIKRGSEYWVRAIAIREEDGVPLIVYQDASTGTCWVRPFVEFIDGRFGRIAEEGDKAYFFNEAGEALVNSLKGGEDGD